MDMERNYVIATLCIRQQGKGESKGEQSIAVRIKPRRYILALTCNKMYFRSCMRFLCLIVNSLNV